MKPNGVVQIVRRFGPVGGMETYVWRLTRALRELGIPVRVICETVHASVPQGIEVHRLGSMARRPRWLAAWRFSGRVSRFVSRHTWPGWLFHSHEATAVHQVTTFHGPPFARVLERPWWRRMSPRVWGSLLLERREVCGPQVRCVVPNSVLIRQMLEDYYPCIGERMGPVIAPGVDAFPRRRPRADVSEIVVGFAGREWRRKGLDRTVRILRAWYSANPRVRLIVAGPSASEVRHLFAHVPFEVSLLGDVDLHDFYARIDLLLHPARMEPFGMVVTEALSAGVPAVVSDQCGARSEVHPSCIVPEHAPVEQWVQACERAILHTGRVSYRRSWLDVAREHVALYEQIDAQA